VGLGANLGDPRRQILDALSSLAGMACAGRFRRSRLYRTEPLGPPGQPDYFNAVAALESELEPLQLLRELQRLETVAGRQRELHWGPRTLDLDLLLYGEQRIESYSLRLPHPRIFERIFVLMPLADLDPELMVPGQGRVRELLAHCPPLRAEPIAWSDGVESRSDATDLPSQR
jgi:2-amino-4-hydroxy-6-hydroxymethyldihydropteridine diphosphokinase